MRIVIQEAKNASVTSEGTLCGTIGRGEVLLVGFEPTDDEKVVDLMIQKLLKLRIFEDENGMTNLSLAQKGGSILAVSQFTLYADMRHGNRPSFTSCMKPDEARVLFDHFKKVLKEQYSDCGFGVFQTAMEVTLTNVGPFTILLDSDELGIKGDKII